jgi:hypothetical protein
MYIKHVNVYLYMKPTQNIKTVLKVYLLRLFRSSEGIWNIEFIIVGINFWLRHY